MISFRYIFDAWKHEYFHKIIIWSIFSRISWQDSKLNILIPQPMSLFKRFLLSKSGDICFHTTFLQADVLKYWETLYYKIRLFIAALPNITILCLRRICYKLVLEENRWMEAQTIDIRLFFPFLSDVNGEKSRK